MKKCILLVFSIFSTLLFSSLIFFCQEQIKPTLKDLHPYLITTPPTIDGILDEEVWKNDPTLDDVFIIIDPAYGEILPQKTKVWVAYDVDNIYFAFYCHDTEPEKIKATVSKRDDIFSDDYIIIILDTLNNKQNAYEFFVNPYGMQADAYRTSNSESTSSDWVWYSAAKLNGDGYTVEAHLPLKNFRYVNGKDVNMGIIFGRKISRLSSTGGWPDLPPGKGMLESCGKIIFKELNSQLKLEVLPSVTYGSIWDRKDPENWKAPDDKLDFGVSVKYGLTSSTTLDATINPDFSQVESDSFQIVVNQRYPIFYNEKRSFFMEAGDIFNMAGSGGDSFMTATVHTRTIVDPAWGLRLTGQLGKASFGLLASGDEWPGREFEDEVNPNEGRKANYYIGRTKISLEGENYIGAFYSGREFGDEYNRVFGADMKFYFGGNHILQGHYLYSFSNDPLEKGKTDGGELTMLYLYDTRPLTLEAIVEDYAKGFEMDTAFYRRTGFTRIAGYIGPNFYPDPETTPWLIKVNPYFFGWYMRDKNENLDDILLVFCLRTFLTKQGYFQLQYVYADEAWAGRNFVQNIISTNGNIQLTNWLYLEASFGTGDALYYDEAEPFLGKSLSYSFATQIQPTDNFTQTFTYIHQDFDRASDGSDVYEEDIFRSRTVYQFNENFFIRAVIQYDSYLDVILTDLLASFTLIPGTVLHVGYGSLHENLEWKDNEWHSGTELAKLYQTSQSLFIKASYNFQL
jgi:hypothetical protein